MSRFKEGSGERKKEGKPRASFVLKEKEVRTSNLYLSPPILLGGRGTISLSIRSPCERGGEGKVASKKEKGKRGARLFSLI